MGGFRSKPDLVKHTINKESLGLTYAVSSMCGTYLFNQVGDSTWRILTSPPCSPIGEAISLQSSMDTEVLLSPFRS